MNLVIDIGNSFTKTAVFDHRELVNKEEFKEFSENELQSFLEKNAVKACIVSSVAAEKKAWYLILKRLNIFIELNSTTPIPIINNYSTPQTLGNDRLANVVGANALFPHQNVLVIDAGTCLKFDFISSEGAYLGGAISPGLQMRYKALYQFTGRLPLLEPTEKVKLIGDSTADSIHSGVINGMLAEIKEIVHQYEKLYDPLQLILCGGDEPYFSNHLKNNIFAAPYLTLQGLNEILLYNQ